MFIIYLGIEPRIEPDEAQDPNLLQVVQRTLDIRGVAQQSSDANTVSTINTFGKRGQELGQGLKLAGLGRSLMSAAAGGPLIAASKIGADFAIYLSNWQNWSALLATATSVLAILTGVVKGLSGWLWAFHQGCWQALSLKCIQQRTYRDHCWEPREKPDEDRRATE